MTLLPIEDRRLAGIGLMLLACLLFTAIDSCAKWLVLAGLPTFEVAFVRYAGHILMVVALFMPQQGIRLAQSSDPKMAVLRALLLLAATVLNFFALNYLPLTLTSAILFTAPLWVCMLSIPILGEQVGLRRWVAVLIGFGGILIVTRPWSAEAHWAVVLSLATSACVALYAILTRRLAGYDSTETQQFYAATIATLAIAPIALSDWQWPATGIDWWVFFMIGIFGWSGHQALVVAHRFAPATTLAPFVYIQIVYMSFSSWLIFNDPPDIWVLAGAGVVLASGLYIWLRERQLAV